MNRRQKIIVSVTGIILVLLLLVGLTYAYFLTQITGNTNDKSILVSTANLALVYGNDDGSIIGEGETIIPGTTFEPKTFTVTNNGNATTDYVVVIENVSIKDIATGNITTFESNDFTYTLTCESGCDGVDTATTFPINGGILVGNSIEVDEVQTYSFTLTYEETGINQTNDMNKSLEARINIKDISSINPYSDNTSSLAYNIINNSVLNKNGTELLAVPKSVPASENAKYATEKYELPQEFYGWDYLTYGDTQIEANNSSNFVSGNNNVEKCNSVKGKYISGTKMCMMYCEPLGKVGDCSEDGTPYLSVFKDEQSLSIENDDYGTSYYYRGAVVDNFLNFGGMCWRIVRIEGDGSVKLILQDRDDECENSDGNWNLPISNSDSTLSGSFGYSRIDSIESMPIVANYLSPQESIISSSMSTVFKNFQNNFSQDELNKLRSGNWCYNDTAYNKDGKIMSDVEKVSYYENRTNFYYDSGRRLNSSEKSTTLKCNGTFLNNFNDNTKMYVGTLTIDEVVYAGHDENIGNSNQYLMNSKNNAWWTLSLSGYDGVQETIFISTGNGIYMTPFLLDTNLSFRPSIVLLAETVISKGDGTKNNPYIVE